MSRLFASNCQRCAEIGQVVRLDQTEEKCRSDHGCEQPNCPLRADFMPLALEELLLSSKKA